MFPELLRLSPELSVTSFGFCLGLGVLIAWHLVHEADRPIFTAGIAFGALAHVLALYWQNDGLPSTLFAAGLLWSFAGRSDQAESSRPRFSGAFAVLLLAFVVGAHLDGWIFGVPLEEASSWFALSNLPMVSHFPPGSPAYAAQLEAGLIEADALTSVANFPVTGVLLVLAAVLLAVHRHLHTSTMVGALGLVLLWLSPFRADPYGQRGTTLFCVLCLLVAVVAFLRRHMEQSSALQPKSAA